MAHGAAIWLPFVQPFGTVLIGIGAGLIAYRQWRTANNKVRVDLFERRLKEFGDTIKIFDDIKLGNLPNDRDIINLTSYQRRASLLFGKEYVKILSECIALFEQWMGAMARRDVSEAKQKIEQIYSEIQRLRKQFDKYASLAHIR